MTRTCGGGHSCTRPGLTTRAVWLTEQKRTVAAPGAPDCTGCHSDCHLPGADLRTCRNFADVLQAMRYGGLQEPEFALLRSRSRERLRSWAPEQDALFDGPGTLGVVPTRREALEITAELSERMQAERIADQGVGLERAWAAPLAARVAGGLAGGLRGKDTDDDGGIASRTWLFEGAPVMFLQNMSPDLGLLNGATGTVRRIVYMDGERPSADASTVPQYVVVEVPGWDGPQWSDDPTQRNWVPVIPVKTENKRGVRVGFPFKCVFAVTVLKSQRMTVGAGCTWDRVLIPLRSLLGESRARRMGFVAFSRTKTLDAVTLRGQVPTDDRLVALVSSEVLRAEDTRLEEVAQATRARLDQRAAGWDTAGLVHWARGCYPARAPGA